MYSNTIKNIIAYLKTIHQAIPIFDANAEFKEPQKPYITVLITNIEQRSPFENVDAQDAQDARVFTIHADSIINTIVTCSAFESATANDVINDIVKSFYISNQRKELTPLNLGFLGLSLNNTIKISDHKSRYRASVNIDLHAKESFTDTSDFIEFLEIKQE